MMKGAFTPGVSKHPRLTAIAVAGALSVGILGAGAVRSAEPNTEAHGHHHMDHDRGGDRCCEQEGDAAGADLKRDHLGL